MVRLLFLGVWRQQVNRLESEILLWPEQIAVRDEMNLYGFLAFAPPHLNPPAHAHTPENIKRF
jgi:hypothetical protein